MHFVRNLQYLLNKQNQDYLPLWYHDSRIWVVSINMKVQLQLAQMVQEYINTYGNKLADRNFEHVCTVGKPLIQIYCCTSQQCDSTCVSSTMTTIIIYYYY